MTPSSTPPDVLFHYTDSSALISIIKNRQLWGSNARYLNDAQEMIIGQAALRKSLTDHANFLMEREREEGRGGDTFQAQLALSVIGFMDQVEDDRHEQAFVASFCEMSDLLSQWQMYGRNGFAIGFSRDATFHPTGFHFDPHGITYAHMQPLSSKLEPVNYVKSEEVTDFVKSALTRLVPPGANPFQRGRPFLDAKEELIRTLAQMKHDAFRQECEWRLSFVRRDFQGGEHPATDFRPALEFRNGPTGIIPYIPFSFTTSAVRYIIVGPGGDQKLRASGLRAMLREMNYDAEVELSEVPYRTK